MLAADGTLEPPAPPTRPRSRLLRRGILVGAVVAAAIVVPRLPVRQYVPFLGTAARPDLLTHTVKREFLPVSVVERGTLESVENREVVCRVKAGSRGTFSSTIKWVIDDGTMVTKGQLLMELDDSALQEQFRAQSIVVEKAKAEWEKADSDYVIVQKQGESDIALAVAALSVAELDVEKYLGLRVDHSLDPIGAVLGGVTTLTERGEYRQRYDDVSGRLKLAESDLEAYRDRFAWAERSVKLGYLTASQAKVEQSKYAGATDNLEKLQKEKYILETFLRQRELTDLLSKVDVARIDLERVTRQDTAKRAQADSVRRTAKSVYLQELEKLTDTADQIARCKLLAPQDGMVVYFKPESSRFSSSNQNLIAVGEQVREGQKLMRIPDLRRMQVNTKVHEAMVSRIRGDERQGTGYFDVLRAGMGINSDGFTRLVGGTIANHETTLASLRDQFHDSEYTVIMEGQKANVRVDAFPDHVMRGHVRVVAPVASMADFFTSDVKVYQTFVTIDEYVPGLKPDMSAEVTIAVDPPTEPVLAIPLQAVVGGAEGGLKRRVFVIDSTGPVEREVVLGTFNEKMVEIREGIAEGDVVVLNPKVLLGDTKVKTRDEAEAPSRNGSKGGAGKSGKGKGNPKGGPGKAPPMKQ